jgi:hypothetical protein
MAAENMRIIFIDLINVASDSASSLSQNPIIILAKMNPDKLIPISLKLLSK